LKRPSPAIGQEEFEHFFPVQRCQRKHVEQKECHVNIDKLNQEITRCRKNGVNLVGNREQTQPQDECCQHCHYQVGERSGDRSEHDASTVVLADHVRVDRHRFCPAETSQNKHKRAEWVKVFEGVEGQATGIRGSAITKACGNEGVRKFVHGQSDDQGNDPGDELSGVKVGHTLGGAVNDRTKRKL